MYYFVSTNSEIILIMTYKKGRGRRGRDSMVVGFTTTCAISVITTHVVSSNPRHGDVYSILYRMSVCVFCNFYLCHIAQ